MFGPVRAHPVYIINQHLAGLAGYACNNIDTVRNTGHAAEFFQRDALYKRRRTSDNGVQLCMHRLHTENNTVDPRIAIRVDFLRGKIIRITFEGYFNAHRFDPVIIAYRRIDTRNIGGFEQRWGAAAEIYSIDDAT